MKRIFTIMITALVSLAMTLGLFVGPASAGGHEWHDDVDPHGHVMLLGVEVDDGFVYFDHCVELANGEALRGPAHHHSVHTGPAGGSPFAQGPLYQAGNWVIPLHPFHDVPFTGCESFVGPFPAP